MALQKQLRGLSNLVGLYEGGNLQLELIRGLQLQVPGLEFFGDFRWRTDLATWNATATEFSTFTVPDDEIWLMTDGGCLATGPNGAGTQINSLVNMKFNNGTVAVGLTPQLTHAAFAYVNNGFHLDSPLFLNPGDSVGFFCVLFAGVGVPVQSSIRYAAVKV